MRHFWQLIIFEGAAIGTFLHELALSNRNNEFTVTSTDKAGNSSMQKINIRKGSVSANAASNEDPSILYYHPLPFRLEASGTTEYEAKTRAISKGRFQKHGILLVIILAASLLISVLSSFFPDGSGVLKTAQVIVNLLFIVFFVSTAFHFFIFLATNKKDYSGGYLEVYEDHITVRQRAHFVNNNSWESAEIWYDDLIRMWNTTDKSNSRALRLNRDIERYTDGICFEYISGRRSHSESVAKSGVRPGVNVFRLNCDGYAKSAILNAAMAVHSAARSFNAALEYNMI